MAPQKETLMVLKVDLDCYRCYTKVKRLLCCYPQIQDQIYNEKQNTVTIKVVCCTPEKIRDKLASKAGKSIKAIQILELKKPADKPPASKPKEEAPADKAPKPAPPADKPPKDAAPADKPPKEAAPADKPPKDAAPKPAAPADDKPPEKMKKNGSKNGSSKPEKPQGDAPAAKPKEAEGAAPKPAAGPKPAEQAAAMVHVMPPELIQCYPGYPVNAGCMECYDGRMCYHGNGYGYGAPPPPPPPAGGWGYYGGGGGGYGYDKPAYSGNRYGDYVSDENPTGCVVM